MTKQKKDTMRKLGILAGNGVLPAVLIERCQKEGCPFFVLALKGHAEEDLLPKNIPVKWVRLGSAGKMYRLLKSNNVQDLVMIGGVRRPSLSEIFPDFYGWKLICKIGLKKHGDDGLLRRIVQEIEHLGFSVRGIHEFLPELLAPEGVLTKVKPSSVDIEDISRGCYVAKLLGLGDVGQSVIVQQGLVLSVEGIEGTKALIERTGQLRRKGKGGILVKTAKPMQDTRVDLPTIGTETIKSVSQAGLKGIAVEADKVLIPNVTDVIEKANQLNIFVIGVNTNTFIPPILHERLNVLTGVGCRKNNQKSDKRKGR
ncbi:MAG: LpxI family protein [Alphaproteobacteria bacterium]|nr:LpxI family protein [Alphaproteobacteria bacterium]